MVNWWPFTQIAKTLLCLKIWLPGDVTRFWPGPLAAIFQVTPPGCHILRQINFLGQIPIWTYIRKINVFSTETNSQNLKKMTEIVTRWPMLAKQIWSVKRMSARGVTYSIWNRQSDGSIHVHVIRQICSLDALLQKSCNKFMATMKLYKNF